MDTPTRSTYIRGPEEWLSMNHDTLQRISEEMYASVDNSEKGLRITGQHAVSSGGNDPGVKVWVTKLKKDSHNVWVCSTK